MTDKKPNHLKEMGISCWGIRNPQLFVHSNENDPKDLSAYSLVLISDSEKEGDDLTLILNDILEAFSIEKDETYCCTHREFEHYQGALPTYLWSMSDAILNQPNCHFIKSVPLHLLINNGKEKKALWDQFCKLSH